MLERCECFGSCDYDKLYEDFPVEKKPFSLPSPLPQWPPGQGFATGKMCLGEIEVVKITKFSEIWSYVKLWGKEKGVSFYKPVEIPDGYFCLGHYCQQNDVLLRGYVLVAKAISTTKHCGDQIRGSTSDSPPLTKPLNYSLVWSADSRNDGQGFIWLPNAPVGYKSMGFVVTIESDEPDLEEVRCVRVDLTESCEAGDVIFDKNTFLSKDDFQIWNTRPSERGMFSKGVPVGTFFCSRNQSSEDELNIACLKNLDASFHAMPNLDQVHALFKHYGPSIFH
ncbi:unnamed protein product [Fraxinus pennsylvanica]|uniref:Uncharacterized protein n=1 Tax=Fraxinus pennsylvanica TaxID=56036 RepID=A0AAD1YXR1_9LAMI|nr:unnamed protein product [Fraxinus pennsylvanica]